MGLFLGHFGNKQNVPYGLKYM